MFEVIQVRLREAGKIPLYDTGGLKVEVGSFVIVETERGLDYGQVISEPEVILDSDIGEPLKKVKRPASREDLNHIKENKKKARDAFNICTKRSRNEQKDV